MFIMPSGNFHKFSLQVIRNHTAALFQHTVIYWCAPWLTYLISSCLCSVFPPYMENAWVTLIFKERRETRLIGIIMEQFLSLHKILKNLSSINCLTMSLKLTFCLHTNLDFGVISPQLQILNLLMYQFTNDLFSAFDTSQKSLWHGWTLSASWQTLHNRHQYVYVNGFEIKSNFSLNRCPARFYFMSASLHYFYEQAI